MTKTNKIDTIAQQSLNSGVTKGVFSGAQAAWWHVGNIGISNAGTVSPGVKTGVNEHTLFDVASLTKLFTLAVICRLHQRGILDMTAPLKEWNVNRDTGIFAPMTPIEVMAHESGLPAWLPLFAHVPLPDRETTTGMNRVIEQIFALREPHLTRPPRGKAIYSDLGFIALGYLLERHTGQGLDVLVQQEICVPLSMQHTGFSSVLSHRLSRDTCAETGTCPWAGTPLIGKVHDDNARAMGGIAGHAGVFSCARDMATFCGAWLSSLTSGEWIERDIVQRLIAPRSSGRGIGFDIKSSTTSAAGNSASPRTFGHLGFTGTSVWMDPARHTAIVLLTNRVRMGTSVNGIRDFRRRFHGTLFRQFPLVTIH